MRSPTIQPAFRASRFLLPLLLAAWQAGADDARACSVPVFRYALERWAADWYECDVFYRGSLTAGQRTKLSQIEDHCLPNGGEANLEVVRANLDSEKLAPDLADLWQSQGEVPLPHVVVRMPKGGPVVWSGPLSNLDGERLLNSPARREIGRRLLAGHSAVWVLVGARDAKATIAARELLAANLHKLEEEIPLPPGVGLPGSELLAMVPLAVKFSFVEIDPSDAAEALLLGMLATRRGEKIQASDTLLSAVFGRGRLIDVFGDDDISQELLSDVSQFLCGACSCQVKQLNPGVDLLISTHWEQKLFEGEPPDIESQTAADEDAPPVMVSIPRGLSSGPTTNVIPKQAPEQPGQSRESSPASTVAWSVILAGLALFVVTVVRGGRTV